MAHVVPTTNPTILYPPAGTTITGLVTLEADPGSFDSGQDVQFGTGMSWYLDDRLVASGDFLGTEWSPNGYAQGAHTLTAKTCNRFGCAATGTSVPVTIDLPAPTLTGPAEGDAVDGVAAANVTSPAGGRVAVYDGTTRLTRSRGPLEINLTGLDGSHALQAVLCDSTGAVCEGSRSAVVNVTSTSAAITRGAVTNAAFSPNGDGLKDAVSVDVTTVGTQSVQLRVLDDAGTQIYSEPAQELPEGTHTMTWNGSVGLVDPAPSGVYEMRVESTDGSGHHGVVSTTVRIDVTPPTVHIPRGNLTTFHPVVDGYQDTFRPLFSLSQAGTAQLVVKNGNGTTVRTLSESLAAGTPGSIVWDGKNAAGALQPSGSYTWTIVATDAAGSRSVSPERSLTLSRKTLVARTATVTKAGTGAYATGGGAACAQETTSGSSYARGYWLRNTCAKGSATSSAVFFTLTTPAAVRYTGYTIRTTGRSHSAPVDVMAGLFSSQTGTYDTTWPIVRVPSGATSTRTLTLGRITSGGHGRTVDLVVFVPNSRLAPLTDWDLKSVSVTVSYQVLA